MADFTIITSRLATGAGVNSVTDAQQIIAAGITAIIDCRAEADDSPFFAGLPVAYLWNGVQDDGQPKPVSWFQASLQFALPLIAGPRQVVYAHCAAGVNRGPSTAYAVLVALGWTASDAEALIRARRPQVGLAYKKDADAAVAALGY